MRIQLGRMSAVKREPQGFLGKMGDHCFFCAFVDMLILELFTPLLFTNCNCNYIFIQQVVLAKRQQRNLLVFESSYHLPTSLPHAVEASHCPL